MPVDESFDNCLTLEDLDELAASGAQINVNDGRIVSIDSPKKRKS